MLFFIKKVITPFLLPSTLIFMLILLSFFLILLKKKWGKILLGLALIFYYVFSISPVSHLLLKGLENKYSPLDDPPASVQYVVVLGGGIRNPFSSLLPHHRLDTSSFIRVFEGVRLYKKIQDGYLIVSGRDWTIRSPIDDGCVDMKKFSLLLGVEEDRIILECRSRDTFEEAQEVKKIIGEKPFLLVTSAYHMPRAMNIFKKLGLKAIPAPCDFKAQGKNKKAFLDFIPAGMSESNLAIKEYMGILLSKIT